MGILPSRNLVFALPTAYPASGVQADTTFEKIIDLRHISPVRVRRKAGDPRFLSPDPGDPSTSPASLRRQRRTGHN